MAHTHAWQVNILTTGSICEIQICPAGTIVWLALINETHVRFFTVQEVSFFITEEHFMNNAFYMSREELLQAAGPTRSTVSANHKFRRPGKNTEPTPSSAPAPNPC